MTAPLALEGGSPIRTSPFPSWPIYGQEEADAIVDVLHSRAWGSTTGHVVATFEEAFASFASAPYCTCVCNGTVALDVALRAAGVGPGDEVLVPTYTFIATVSAVLFVGAVPVFVDIDAATHLIDPTSVAARIGERTKALIAVHIAGRPCDMDALLAVTARAGIALIEDAAQAHGATWRGDGVGTFGVAGTFSFQSSKNVTAGEGGAVVSTDPTVADRIYGLANVGRIRGGEWYDHRSVGYNLRLTEFQAAILLRQLARQPDQAARREASAARLTSELANVADVMLPPEDDRITVHARHLFLFRIPRLARDRLRDRFVTALRAEGIPSATGYVGHHENEAVLAMARKNARLAGYDYVPATCPVADVVARDTVWLPQYVLLAEPDEMADVAQSVVKVLDRADALPQ